MGIGLNVAAEILRAHGGELRVENAVNGAVVTFVLPLAENLKP
jgi:signal transduction histidine kinase